MLFLSAGATTVVAQDASNCNSNSSISHEAVRAGNFKDAYTPWKAVLENCPTLRFYTFTDGYKILKGLMAQIKDKNNPEYQKYFDELMNTHDLSFHYNRNTAHHQHYLIGFRSNILVHPSLQIGETALYFIGGNASHANLVRDENKGRILGGETVEFPLQGF